MKRVGWLKVVVSCAAILLALLRLFFFEAVGKRMDSTFFLLLGISVAVFVTPWEKVTNFKGWGVELTLDRAQVKGALEAAGVSRLKNTPLWEELQRLEPEIQKAQGSRVLWIDDHPHDVISERRVLRALGVEVVAAQNSQSAEDILQQDNDFDLIISDVQRKDAIGDQATRYGGIYFIKRLREKYKDDVVIRSLPVIFYSAYRPEQITIIKQQVGEGFLEQTQFIGAFDLLLPAVITILARVRSSPVTVRPKKKATSAV